MVGGEAPAGTFAKVEAYDPQTNRWSVLPHMPTRRHGLGAATIGDRLNIIAGGPKPGASASPVVEILAP